MQNSFEEFSLFRLFMNEYGNVSIQNDHQFKKFDPKEYSRFKYGDGDIANYYAKSLADLLINQGAINKKTEYFLSGSAYQEVPTAATSIAKELATVLSSRGYSINLFKIHSQAFTQDYSGLSLAARGSMLSKLKLSIDPTLSEQLSSKKVIVIDDVQITGLHTQLIQKLLSSIGVSQITFGYVAVLSNRKGKDYPLIEWSLNHSEIDDLQKLSKIVLKENFLPNARICKFILAASPTEIEGFVKSVTLDKLFMLLTLMRADGYHEQPEYQENFQILSKTIYEKKLQELDISPGPAKEYLSVGA